MSETYRPDPHETDSTSDVESSSRSGQTPRLKVDAESLFHAGPMTHQIEHQIGLLTKAMTTSMLLATGICPGLTEDFWPGEEPTPASAWQKRKAKPQLGGFAVARSLQLRDAAHLSMATASLVNAFVRLRGPFGQRFTTRHTFIPDPSGKKKPRKITTLTHHLVATEGNPLSNTPLHAADGAEDAPAAHASQ